jgi:hypothetical protein
LKIAAGADLPFQVYRV